jgi:O-antigen/teichoic acid export membrane protein
VNRNIAANIAGRFWTTLSNVIFLPLYIYFLGIDNYAVISFTLIVSGMLMVLDIGLSASIMREVARRDVTDEEKYRTFRTLEKIYFLLLLLCVLIGQFLAAPIAHNFINNTPVDRDLVALCLKIIAAEAGLQLLFRFYLSTMMGLERQVEANIFNIAWGTARNGAVLLLLLVWPNLTAFFAWQLFVTLLTFGVAKWRIEPVLAPWRPAEELSGIDWAALRRIRGFAAGIFLVALVALANTQLDRIMLSRLLDLEYLGYYNVAIALGTGMIAVASPFQAAIQPRLTAYFSERRGGEAGVLYLQIATLVAVLAFPLMATIAVNSNMVVMAWTGNALVAEKAGALVPPVIMSYTCLGISSLTYSVALANGYTRYNNVLGLASLCISIPGYWIVIGHHGAIGAAILFLAIQASVSIAFHILINRRFLHFGTFRTFCQLFLIPGATAWACAILFAHFSPAPSSRVMMLLYLGAGFALALAGTALIVMVVFRIRWRLSDLGVQP